MTGATKPTILVADDDPDVRLAMQMRLAEAGFSVHPVATGMDALAAIELLDIDAVLLDVQMPDMDGFAVCERIRRRPECRDVPVFMLTGTSNKVVRDHFGKLTETVGATKCVTKPFDAKALAGMVWASLDHCQAAIPPATH